MHEHEDGRAMSRRKFLAAAGAGGAAVLLPGLGRAQPVRATGGAAKLDESLVLQWNTAALQGVRESKLGPPMVARALAVVHTCAYDAWAAYDPVAVGTRLLGGLRRPATEQTLANKTKAVSFAAYA